MMSDSETGVNKWSKESLGGSWEISEGWLDDSREFNGRLILSILASKKSGNS